MRWPSCKPILLLVPACCPVAPLNAQNLPNASAVVTLRESVSIQQPRIRLSDLLPASADQQLRQAAVAVDLGRSPEPGSFRVFTSDELSRRGASKLRVQIPEEVVVHADGFRVKTSALRRALADLKALPTRLTATEISIPEEVVTRTENAVFRVVRAEPGSDSHTVMAFVKCETRTDCGAYVARLRFSETVHWTTVEPRPAVKTFGRGTTQNSLVRPGRPASLRFDEAGMRITMPVYPLRRAAMGESVRVLDKASRRIYLARVSGENQVVAHLEEKK